MENALVDLAQALRDRLAIIRDEESRRDTEAHMARLSAVSEKIDKLQAALKDRQTASSTATPNRSATGALSSAPQLRQSARILKTIVAALVSRARRPVAFACL